MIWAGILIYVGIAMIVVMLDASFSDTDGLSINSSILIGLFWPLVLAAIMGFVIRGRR
jgi:hypothetical protein